MKALNKSENSVLEQLTAQSLAMETHGKTTTATPLFTSERWTPDVYPDTLLTVFVQRKNFLQNILVKMTSTVMTVRVISCVKKSQRCGEGDMSDDNEPLGGDTGVETGFETGKSKRTTQQVTVFQRQMVFTTNPRRNAASEGELTVRNEFWLARDLIAVEQARRKTT